MLMKAFSKRPLIENDESSVITFANHNKVVNVYDFEFTSFADPNFICEAETPFKNLDDVFEDKMSTNDEDEDLQMLVSLIKVPAKTQRRNSCSLSQKSPFDFEYLNLKRNCSDFHSMTGDDNSINGSGHRAYHSDKQTRKNIQLLDDSIDVAIMAKNMSMISFDDDVVHDVYEIHKRKSKKLACQSKRVKMSLDC